MQLCTGGDLFTYLLHHIDTRARLSEGETKYIMFQLFKALSYLHRQNIAHRG
jgi:meiosis-specific serine/threonine-protein kinase MEK1